MSSEGIAGYTCQAENLCPGCTLVALSGNSTAAVEFEFDIDAIDNWLRTTGAERCIDFDDVHTYGSDDFPKVILTDQATGERCGRCHEQLLG